MPTLKDEALSCTFASTMWKAERLDRKLASEIEVTHNNTTDLGRFHRKLFPGCDAPLKLVLNSIENVRAVHEFYSVPWPPTRAVKIQAFSHHRDATREAIGRFDVALQALYEAYPSMVTEGLRNSNGLSSPAEYIPREDLLDRFSVTITYGQMEDPNNWLTSPLLTPQQAQDLVTQSNTSQQRLLDGVLSSLKDQLATCFKSARENLAKVQPIKLTTLTGATAAKFRFNVAWLINLKQLCEMIPSFNIGNDPTLPQIVLDLQPILRHTPETMRTSASAQADATSCLESTIATYSDWLNS